jgi:hypothetical protein
MVVVDEFLDCGRPRLDVVRALSKITRLIVAADGFQVLDDIHGCPAIDWVDTLEETECERHSLTGCHRTTQMPILNAARALRENTRVAGTVNGHCVAEKGTVPKSIRSSQSGGQRNLRMKRLFRSPSTMRSIG